MQHEMTYKKATGKNRGISLLETLIYVTILASMLVMVINTLIPLSVSFVGIRLSREVNTSAIIVLERITSEVKKAKSINQAASVFNVSPGILALSTTDDIGHPSTILFSVVNGALRISSGGVDIGELTASNVAVSNFIVKFIDTGRSGVVAITLGLTGTRGKTTMSDTFQTAAVTRNQGM